MQSTDLPVLNEKHWLWSLKGVLAITAVYCFVHSFIRLLVSDTIGQDDVAANILAQTFELGYIVRQGPLYDMSLWAVQQITGPTILSFHLLKYGYLFLTVCFIYLAAQRLFQSYLWAAMTALSLSLFYQIGWNIHEGVTHTLALMTAIMGAFWAFLMVCEQGRWYHYSLLGLFLGLGFLSKHTFGIFVLLLFSAAMMQTPLRSRILHPSIFWTILCALLVMAPYLFWLSERLASLQNEAQDATGVLQLSYWQRLEKGLPLALVAPLGFTFPLIALVPLVFPHTLKSAKAYFQQQMHDRSGPGFEKLILHMIIGAFILISIGLFVFGVWRFAERYMHPFFLVSLFSLMGLAKFSKPSTHDILRFLKVMLLVSCGILVMRLGILWIQEPFCKPCRQNIPFAGLAEAIRKEGFQQGIIIAGYRHEGGNLRQLFPDSHLISVENPSYVPPALREKYQRETDVIAVWSPERHPEGVPEQIIKEFERLGIRQRPSVKKVTVPWKHLWKPEGYRVTTWHMIFIPAHQ